MPPRNHKRAAGGGCGLSRLQMSGQLRAQRKPPSLGQGGSQGLQRPPREAGHWTKVSPASLVTGFAGGGSTVAPGVYGFSLVSDVDLLPVLLVKELCGQERPVFPGIPGRGKEVNSPFPSWTRPGRMAPWLGPAGPVSAAPPLAPGWGAGGRLGAALGVWAPEGAGLVLGGACGTVGGAA